MKFITDKMIKIDRELSDLDLFTLDFIKILRRYTKYAIISGYVSILLGRARASEDVDVIIPRMNFHDFSLLLKELKEHYFYCLNAESDKLIFEYLDEKYAIRFAKRGTVIPNIELKFSKSKIDELTLNKTITVRMAGQELIISHLELQIAFKEQILKSPKDIEDARHIRNIAKEHLNQGLIKKYEVMLHDFY